MRYHHGNLKSNLIDCAYEWIASNGIDNISLRKIAEIAEDELKHARELQLAMSMV